MAQHPPADGNSTSTSTSNSNSNSNSLLPHTSSALPFDLCALYDAESGVLLPQYAHQPIPLTALGGGTGFLLGYLVRTFGRGAIAGAASMYATVQLLHFLGYLDTRRMKQDALWAASTIDWEQVRATIGTADAEGGREEEDGHSSSSSSSKKTKKRKKRKEGTLVTLEDRLREAAAACWTVMRRNALVTGAFAVGLALAFK